MSDQNTDAPLPAFASSDHQQQQHLTVMSHHHHHHQQQHNNSNSNSGFGFNSGEGTGGCLSSGQASTIAPGDIPTSSDNQQQQILTPTAHPQGGMAFAQPPLLSTRDATADDPDGDRDDDDDAAPPTERSSRSSSFASLPPSANTLEEDMMMLRRNRESNDNNGGGFMLPQGRDAFVPARLRRRNSRAGLVDLDEDHDPLSASNHAGSGNGGSSSFRSGGAHARPPISPFAPPGTSFGGGGGGGLQLNLSDLSGSPNFSNAGGDSAAHNNNNNNTNNTTTGSNGGHPPPLHFLGSPEGGFVMSSAGSNTIQYGTTSLLSSGSRQSFSTSHHASNHLQYSPSWKPIITAPNLFVASQRDVNVFENHAAYSITAFLCMALEATPPSFLLAGSSHNRAFLESVCQGESQLDEIQDAQHHQQQQPPLPQRYTTTTQQSTDAGDASFTSIFTNNNSSMKNIGNPNNGNNSTNTNPFTNNTNTSNTPSQFFCQPEHPKSHLCFPDSTVTDGDVTINSTTYSFLKISMKDNSDQQLKPNFDKAFAFIDQMRKQNRNIVVYCQQGKSRSVSTVVGWLMRRQKIPYEQAFSMVKQARRQAEPNPYFMDQLRRVNANASATGGPLIPSGYASQYESRRGSVTLAVASGPNSPGTQNLTLSQLQLRTPLPTNFSCESLDHHHQQHQQQQQYYLDHPHHQQQQQFDGSGGGDPMSDDGGGGSHGRNKSRKPPANWGQFHCFKTPEVGSPSISSPLAGVSLDPNSVQQPSFEKSGAIPELVLDVQHASPTTNALANARDSSDGGGSDGAFVSRHNSDTSSLHGQYKQYQQHQHHHHNNHQHHHHAPNLQNHATIFARASGDSGSSPSHHNNNNNNTNAVVSPDGTFGMDHSNLSGPGLSPAAHQHHNNNFVSSSSVTNLAPPPPGNTSMRSNSSLTLMVPSPGLESVPVSASHSQLRRSTSGMSGISPHMRITPQHHQQLQRAHFTRSTSPQPPVLMHLSNDGYSAASNSMRFSSDASPGSATHHQGNSSNFQQYSTNNNNNVAAAPGQTFLGTPMSAIAHHNPNSATASYDDAWNASVVAELETNEKEEEEEVHAMLSGGGVLSDEK